MRPSIPYQASTCLQIRSINYSFCNKNYDSQILYRPEGCNILDRCTVKARLFNKIGARLNIQVPTQGSLTVKNIIFDSIDSILDCKSLI
ncbi:hypothetical protein FGO68_gene15870 [Halteria grandinella]|uniref:Uncharacterized protein n=1 Tax=Halteria grandinella TaxID=5974 RepID=A0A8J8P6Z9_HALGN|nr:hypothetical protein FGO68_gene15870 [Halteria grandinella]